MSNWDKRFLRLAREVSTWSKDPSTQVGAVITDDKNRVVSLGYNGFPRGVNDWPHLYKDREEKYKRVLHAEQNAILFADSQKLGGSSLFIYPLLPCHRCALEIIQVGVGRVVTLATKETRWEESNTLALDLLHEAGIKVVSYNTMEDE